MTMEFKPQDHNYFSTRQAAKLLRVSYRTLCNMLDQRKIAYLQVDSYRIIHQNEIDRINADGVEHSPRAVLTGYKTIIQTARLLNIQPQNIKKYIKEERIANVKKGNVYFIPDSTIALWRKVQKPNPNSVEAYQMDALIVKDAALAIGKSVSHTRALIAEGELESIEGYNRKYVLEESIAKYIEIRKALLAL